MLFGKMFDKDEFRYYGYALKFDSLLPAQLATSATQPNTADPAVTAANIAAPVTNIVPGPPNDLQIDFPIGAVILGISSAAISAQRIVQVAGGAATNFPYAPDMNNGRKDMFILDIEYTDGDPITAQNPIAETVFDPNFPAISAPPFMADALMGGGDDTEMPAREVYVAPGLGLLVRVRSLLLPTFINGVSSNNTTPNLTVHLVFHCMIPGVVRQKKAA